MAPVATLRLDSETRQAIARISSRKKITPSAFIRATLAEAVAREEQELSFYDGVSDLIGRADTGIADRSVDTGKKMAALLAARRNDPR